MNLTPIVFRAHRDGSFDIIGQGVRLNACFPALDGVPVRPVAVTLAEAGPNDARITYDLGDGSLSLRLRTTPGGGLAISTTLAARSPAEVAVIDGAAVDGAVRAVVTSWGTGGQAGGVSLPNRTGEVVESHAISGLCDEAGATLVLWASDYRRYAQVTRLRGAARGETHLTAAFATERVAGPGGVVTLPDVYVTQGASPWAAMRAAAVDSGRAAGARTATPRSVHWCSWYYRYYHLTAAELPEHLAGFDAARRAGCALSTVQIDAGYFPHCGDWLDANHRWPGGMAPAFRTIIDAGYRAGIWIGPLMVGNRSRLFAEHPEWVLRDLSGRPVTEWRQYGEERVWGLDDEEVYVLDVSHPGAMDYLRGVFRTFRQWGATFFKTDFLYWAAKPSHTVRRHTPGRTSVEYLVDLLAMIRQEIGPDAYWLACLTPFAPIVGLADAARVSTDVVPDWATCRRIMRDTAGSQPLNNAWFQNDPDSVPLRDWHTHLTGTEVRTLALWMGGLGGTVNTSDLLGRLPPDRLALWRFIASAADAKPWTATEPGWGRRDAAVRLLVRDLGTGRRGVIVVNGEDAEVTERVPVAQLLREEGAGADAAHVWSWGPDGAAVPLGRVAAIDVCLKARASAVYYIADTDPGPPPVQTWDGPVPPHA